MPGGGASGGASGESGGAGSSGGAKRWVAVRDFTSGGQSYREGDPWRGSDEDAEAEVEEGNLREDPAAEALGDEGPEPAA